MKRILAFASLLCLAAPAGAAEKPTGPVPPKAAVAMADRDYGDAIDDLLDAVADKVPEADYLLYLVGRARFLMKKHDKAIETFERIIKREGSPWRRKAIFGMADAMAAKRGFDRAAELYEREVRALLSLERREEVAGEYLRFAEKYFKPEEPEKPNFHKAEVFFKLALEVGLTEARAEEVSFRIGRCRYERQDWNGAIQSLQEMIKKYPKGKLAAEATLFLGRARLKAGDRAGARAAFEDLAADFPQSVHAPQALFEIGDTYGLPNASGADLDLGVKALKTFVDKHPRHELAATARFRIAESFFNAGRTEEAAKAFGDFIEAHRQTELDELARARFLLGECHRRRKDYPAAVKAWRDFLQHHPTHGDWSAAQQRIMQVDFDAAEDARRDKRYGEAAQLYSRFLERYPLSLKNPAAMYALGKLEHDQEHYEEAVREWRKLVSKYPSSAEASQAHLEIAETLDRKLGRSEEALKEYEKVQGPRYSEARQRASQMREKALTVITERAFTTAEKPLVKVRSRNAETLTYRVYRIDLETYFRAYHGIQRIEDLDIALIAPDRTWEEQVPGYAKFREIEREVPLDLQGGGAWVLNVSAKTLEATTLVLVSDLQLVLKASREEVLVYAEDVRREKPYSGVSVVITDGAKPVLEGKTGGDGIFKGRSKDLAEPERLAAFAVASGSHYAASGLDLGGASVGQALEPRALLFTDRPAYRPGAKVGVKGFLREVTNGRHGFKAGQAYTLRISDPGGAVLLEQEVPLDRFGGIDAGYVLPDTATVGTYGISLSRADGPSFSGSFLVAEYTLPRFDLKVDFERKVYFRGERLTGKISVKHYYGEPAVGRQVSYRLGSDGEVRSGATDEQGEIAFDFDSRRFLNTQTVSVRADLTSEGLTAQGTTWIAAAAFRASLSTPREVYLAGEEFSATVRATDVLGEPVAARFDVQAFRITTGTDGATGEALAAEREVQTDADGKGQASFRFDDGGSYRLRARAVDRAGNPVTASLDLFVSGKDDEVKLRLFTERTGYEAGETARLTVHSRVERPNLALVTYEAEGVLGHRLITVPPGKSTLEVEMTEALAPNFNLALALIDGNDFHAVEREFTVDRGLNIEVQSVKEQYRTRDEAEVTLRVTDRLGRPVEAGVALAAVDEALFALYPDRLTAIGDAFYGQQREIGVETSSSCGFKYEPETREVSEELLKEEARAEMEAKLGAKRKARVMAPKPSMAPMEMMADEEMGIGGLGLMGSGAGGGGSGYGMGVGKLGVSKGRAMVMGEPGRMVEARQFFSETAYWNPSVVTAADGTATVTFRLPDSTTTFRLTARGASTGTLFGQGRGKLRVMEPFSLDVKAPVAAVAGDRVRPLALVRNHTGEDVQAEVQVEGEAAKRVAIKAGRDAEVELPAMAVPDRAGVERIPMPVEVRAAAGPHADAVKRSMLIQARGHRVRSGKAGQAGADLFVELELPADVPLLDQRLEIYVGPTPERSLLDAASRAGEGSPWCQAQTADAVLASAAGVRYLAAIGKAGSPTARDLVARIEGLAANLAHSQSPDGSWGFAGRFGKGDPYISASATRALVLARRAGARVNETVLERAFGFLEAQYRSAQDPGKLAILRAQAAAGKANFQHLNRLYRLRGSLRPHLLGPLALALADADREQMARETAEPLGPWVVSTGEEDGPPVEAWYGDRTASLAAAVEALARTDPGGAATRAGAEALLARRWGPGWGSTRATAAAVEALAVYHGKAVRATDNYRLEVLVNGKAVGDLRVQGARGPFVLVAPQGALRGGAQRIDFKLKGRGVFSYSAVLTGVARGFAQPDDGAPIRITRRYEPAPLSYKGQEIPRGFSVLSGSYSTWRNSVTQVPAGSSVRATLEFSRRSGRHERGYLVVEETLPGGMTVLEPSIKGRALHNEIGDGTITFYLGDDQYYGSISYDLLATVPGTYAVPPALLRSASDPAFDNASEEHALEVLSRGERSKDEYRYTPDELYHLGQRYFDDGRKADAAEFLTQLIDGYKLRDSYFKEVARMLLYAALERKDAPAVVKYFEILKEKYPTLVIDFDDIVEIGKAYRDIGEHERALQVFKAAVDASFLVEARVGGALKGQGEFWASTDFTRRLIAEYPDVPVVRNSLYGLGQMLYRQATEAPTTPDPEAVKKKLTRVDFLDAAVRVFNEFLVRYPEDPVADEASFSLASAYLDAAEYEDVVALGRRYEGRYPRSRYLSAAEYIMAFAHFALEEYRRSLDLCRKVATAKYPDGEGGEEESPHRELARYIMGQIFHSMGQPDKAIAEYTRVREMFPDAEEAIRAFERIELSLPEVTDVPLQGRAQVEVSYRNVPEVKIFVYRVDLMKLYVLQKDLENITGVNLSGIRPFFEKTVRLTGGKDHRAHKQAVDLPLQKPGAYLVVAKGDAAAASGMVVRSDLKLEVQEDPASGRVRVNLLDRRDRVVPKAYVKVVGAGDGEFKSEYTDLRGVVAFDEVRGRVTVIAKDRDQYAFYRGKLDLQGDYAEEDAFELQDAGGGPRFKQRALENLNEMNRAIQQQNIDFLEQQIFDNSQQGVEVQMAK